MLEQIAAGQESPEKKGAGKIWELLKKLNPETVKTVLIIIQMIIILDKNL